MNNRRLFVLLGAILLLVLALAGFYLWLNGGQNAAQTAATDEPGANSGLIPVKSIYVYGPGKSLQKPVGIGADPQGNFFVTLRDVGKVIEFDRAGNPVREFGTHGLKPGQLLAPMDVAVDRLADHIYVVDRASLRLIAYDGRGTYLWEVPILGPLSVDVAANGDVLVSTFGPMVRFSSEGEVLKQVGSRGRYPGQFDFPRGAVIDPQSGDVYVADSNNARVQKVKESGTITATVDWILGRPPLSAQDAKTRFGVPSGVTLDPQGRLIVLDGFRNKIEMINPQTTALISDFGGERRGNSDGQFNMPTQISHLVGDYYAVTDTYNDRVQIIRLLGPNATVFASYPWLKWLLLLLLLPLLLLFGRKRTFVTEETLDRAVEDGHVRLLLAVYKKMYVLPEVAAKFEETTEGDVKLGEYLEPVSRKEAQGKGVDKEAAAAAAAELIEAEMKESGLSEPEQRLVDIMQRTTLQRALLARHLALTADEDQSERFAENDVKVMPYEHILEDYAIPEDAEAGAQSA
jgi:DNA-binding beta-propeller fold protein YncE